MMEGPEQLQEGSLSSLGCVEAYHDDVFACLVAAVNIAKEQQVKTVNALKSLLSDKGFDKQVVEQSVNLWTKSLQGRHKEDLYV